MRYKVLYIIFAVSIILYSNFRLFLGLTPRHIMGIVMFAVCLMEDRKLFMDKYFGLYLVFVFGFTISSLVTGYTSLLPRYLLGFYFVAYVAYWATQILIKKYDGANVVINTILVIGVIDALATIGQFYNIPYFTVIPSLMGINVEMDVMDYLESVNVGDEAFGITLPGIMVNDVYNGYFLMTVGVLSLSLMRSGFNLSQLYRLLPWLLLVVASFMVQQRGPFYLLLLSSAFILFKLVGVGQNKSKAFYFIVLAIALPVLARILLGTLLSGESRYNIGLEATNRDSIYAHAWEYIKENPFFGGVFQLFDTRGFAPHNLFLNAWIYGGIVGFIAIVVLTWKQCVLAVKSVLGRVSTQTLPILVTSLAFLCFTANSMLHNVSVVTGDAIVWLMWGGTIACYQKVKLK